MKVKEILWSKRGKMWVTLFARRSTCWNITRTLLCHLGGEVCALNNRGTRCVLLHFRNPITVKGRQEREGERGKDNAGGQCRARKGRARAGHPPPPSVEMPLPLPVAFVTPKNPGQDVRSKLSRQFREVLKTAQTIQRSF